MPLGPHARDAPGPAALAARIRELGTAGLLARLTRDGTRGARSALLGLGHPGGAWLEWL